MRENILFDHWNFLKKNLNSDFSPLTTYLQPKDVWLVSLGKNIGYEQNGGGENFSRPALIIKKFNNQMFWAVPLSTIQKNLDFYYNYTDPFGRPVSAILAQLKLVSIKRCKRLLYRMNQSNFDKIRSRLIVFLS